MFNSIVVVVAYFILLLVAYGLGLRRGALSVVKGEIKRTLKEVLESEIQKQAANPELLKKNLETVGYCKDEAH